MQLSKVVKNTGSMLSSVTEAAGQVARRKQQANPVLKAWRRLIDSAVADAKRTYAGLPTDNAILARCWLYEHRPSEADKDEWERSFACACMWLDLDVHAERARLIAEIDDVLTTACIRHAGTVVYQRKAAVLTCAGVPTRLGKHYVLPLVSEADYEDVAGIVHPDPPPSKRRRQMLLDLPPCAAGRPTRRNSRRSRESMKNHIPNGSSRDFRVCG